MSKQWEFRKDGFVYCKATGERVCSPHSTLPDSVKKFGPHKQDLKANARLICAAPDLLAALKAVEPILCRMYGPQADDMPPVKMVRAAIAKAEGEK